mgnify:CR=1 FL=1|jgi:hypothetical protein|tara:strand:+ start:2825 stop:3274 length:450 start_codon:yes stop_codon:yes gene_type:complete
MNPKAEIIQIKIEDMLEIILKERDDFLKVKETLTRIGVASKKDKKIYQSCHILHKQGKYYIVHFKELFALDGKPTNLSENDIARRNTIAMLLEEWELISIVRGEEDEDDIQPNVPVRQLKILNFKEKDEWELLTKYNIGNSSYEKKEDE